MRLGWKENSVKSFGRRNDNNLMERVETVQTLQQKVRRIAPFASPPRMQAEALQQQHAHFNAGEKDAEDYQRQLAQVRRESLACASRLLVPAVT